VSRVVREAEDALANDPPILFSRGAVPVRPGEVPVEFCDGTKGTTTALYTQSSAAIYGCLSERAGSKPEEPSGRMRIDDCDIAWLSKSDESTLLTLSMLMIGSPANRAAASRFSLSSSFVLALWTGQRLPVAIREQRSMKKLLPVPAEGAVNAMQRRGSKCAARNGSYKTAEQDRAAEISNQCCFFATENSLRVSGDLLRRSLIANLDAEMERPETQRFENDPVEMIVRDRARYVRAALAIVLGYIASGDHATFEPLLGFEEWSATVRSALIWLGCADPAEAIKASRVADPELQTLRSFIGFVRDKFASSAFSVADIINLLSSKGLSAGFEQHCESDDEREQRQARTQEEVKLSAEFLELLLSIAGSRGVVNGKRLSTWLRRNCRWIVGYYRIEERGKDSHTEGMMFAIVTL
jgi:hypothetical protein